MGSIWGSAVKVHGLLVVLDIDGLCCLPLPKPFDSDTSSDFGLIPIDSMFDLRSVDCDTVLRVPSLHCGLVLPIV